MFKLKFHLLFTLFTFVFFYSCSSSTSDFEETQEIKSENIIGHSEFINNIKSIVTYQQTRSSSDTAVQDTAVQQLLFASLEFLEKNNISHEELGFEKSDLRLAIVAMGIAEYYKNFELQTRSTIGGCILQAMGLQDLGRAGAKAIAKRIAKAAVKRMIPYVGWGLFALEMGMCLTE